MGHFLRSKSSNDLTARGNPAGCTRSQLSKKTKVAVTTTTPKTTATKQKLSTTSLTILAPPIQSTSQKPSLSQKSYQSIKQQRLVQNAQKTNPIVPSCAFCHECSLSTRRKNILPLFVIENHNQCMSQQSSSQSQQISHLPCAALSIRIQSFNLYNSATITTYNLSNSTQYNNPASKKQRKLSEPQPCSLCKKIDTNMKSIKCAIANCTNAFHTSCVYRDQLSLIPTKSTSNSTPFLSVYCDSHRNSRLSEVKREEIQWTELESFINKSISSDQKQKALEGTNQTGGKGIRKSRRKQEEKMQLLSTQEESNRFDSDKLTIGTLSCKSLEQSQQSQLRIKQSQDSSDQNQSQLSALQQQYQQQQRIKCFRTSSSVGISGIPCYPNSNESNRISLMKAWWKQVNEVYFHKITGKEIKYLRANVKVFDKPPEELEEQEPILDESYLNQQEYFTDNFNSLNNSQTQYTLNSISNSDQQSPHINVTEQTEDELYVQISELASSLESLAQDNLEQICTVDSKMLLEQSNGELRRSEEIEIETIRIQDYKKFLSILNNISIGYGEKSPHIKIQTTPINMINNEFESEEEQYKLIDTDCKICLTNACTLDNPIVYCATCSASFHQICYGIKVIPPGEFNCHLCLYRFAILNSIKLGVPFLNFNSSFTESSNMTQITSASSSSSSCNTQSPDESFSKLTPFSNNSCNTISATNSSKKRKEHRQPCKICLKKGFPMIDVNHTFYHVSCLIFLNLIHLRDSQITLRLGEDDEEIKRFEDCVRSAVRSSEKSSFSCGVCGKKEGYRLRCSHADCSHSFHLHCAYISGIQFTTSIQTKPPPQYQYIKLEQHNNLSTSSNHSSVIRTIETSSQIHSLETPFLHSQLSCFEHSTQNWDFKLQMYLRRYGINLYKTATEFKSYSDFLISYQQTDEKQLQASLTASKEGAERMKSLSVEAEQEEDQGDFWISDFDQFLEADFEDSLDFAYYETSTASSQTKQQQQLNHQSTLKSMSNQPIREQLASNESQQYSPSTEKEVQIQTRIRKEGKENNFSGLEVARKEIKSYGSSSSLGSSTSSVSTQIEMHLRPKRQPRFLSQSTSASSNLSQQENLAQLSQCSSVKPFSIMPSSTILVTKQNTHTSKKLAYQHTRIPQAKEINSVKNNSNQHQDINKKKKHIYSEQNILSSSQTFERIYEHDKIQPKKRKIDLLEINRQIAEVFSD